MEQVQPPYGYCDFARTSIPPDYREALGLVSIAWSCVEHTVEDAIRLLAGVDVRTAAILLTHASLPQRLDQLLALATDRFADDGVAHVKALRDRVKSLVGTRNDLVHGNWFVEQSSGRVLVKKVKARGALRSDVRHYTADEITQVARDTHALSLDIFTCFDGVRRANNLTDETVDE
ncbi:hypothetical protein [Roseomonas rosulenta]|uniref:hypothetical protein n=1 Tax=Roseomonas rosulenta TaxID=2748667 RepID=UPI0018DFBAF8|nr:hypothetical protein [Roseomonas rosulenta]